MLDRYPVCARELWRDLQVTSDFGFWIDERIREFGFVEGRDFIAYRAPLVAGGRPVAQCSISAHVAGVLRLMETPTHPTRKTRWGFLYVVGFDDGTVKVGRSTYVYFRVRTIEGQANGPVTGRWISVARPDSVEAERELIARCAAIRAPAEGTRETFRIDFAEAVRLAEAVCAETLFGKAA